MSRTSPVQIVNKNGVATTVHKRVDAPVAKKGGSFPIPKVTPDAQLDGMVEHSFEMTLSNHGMSDSVRQKMMATLHPETLGRLREIMRSGTSLIPLNRAMNLSMKNRNFAVLNSMAVLVPEMEVPSVNHQARLMNALIGMQEVRKPKTPEVDMTNPDDPRAEGVRPLINALLSIDHDFVITKTNKKHQQYLTFVDPEVGNLILERPDRADEIVSLYQSRGSFDRVMVEEALDARVPSLSAGTL